MAPPARRGSATRAGAESAARAPEYPDASWEYHLSALNLGFNNFPYSIVGRIVFDFRAEEEGETVLSKLRIAPLISPDSQAAPSIIDVRFRGRWRSACAFLKKREIVCVTQAEVAPADDVEIHNVQLVLRDPHFETPANSRPVKPPIADAALFVLAADGPSRRPVSAVSFKTLASGRLECCAAPDGEQAAARERTVPRNPLQTNVGEAAVNENGEAEQAIAVAAAAAAKPRKKQKTGPQYEYSSVEKMWEAAQPGNAFYAQQFNIYGVMVDARAPSLTRGMDVKSDITVVDESSIRGTSGAMEVKNMTIYRFTRDPRHSIPFRAVGDIVRGHRLKLDRYEQGGRTVVQGNAYAFSSFVLWAGDDDSETPIDSRGATRGPGAAATASHTMTDYDRARVSALRAFSRKYIAGLTAIPRIFQHTVGNVTHAPTGDPWLAGSFNLLALYTPSTAGARLEQLDGRISFTVSDGRPFEHSVVRVASELSDEHRNACPQYRFADFAGAFRFRPETQAGPRWLLIKDARAGPRVSPGAPRSIALRVGKHSSTLLWLPKSAPEVRAHLASQTPTARLGPPDIAALDAAAAAAAAEREALEADLAARWRSAGNHPGDHLPAASVRAVRSAALAGKHAAVRLRARVRGWAAPRTSAQAARPFCSACRAFANGEEPVCGTCGDRLGWAFLVRVILSDEDGCMIEAWIMAEHADTFFAPFVAGDLAADEEGAKRMRAMAKWLLKPDLRLDCLVQPFRAKDENDLPHAYCRVVHTKVGWPKGLE